MAQSYYQENYRLAKRQQWEAEREGDAVSAEAHRWAAIRWLEMEERAAAGLPEEDLIGVGDWEVGPRPAGAEEGSDD